MTINNCYRLEVFNKPRNFDIAAQLSEAIGLVVVSAFATNEGLRRLIPRDREESVTGIVVVGGSNFITTPHVLRTLMSISTRNPGLRAYLCMPPIEKMFHPKVYALTLRDGRAFALVGSANMTGSAFTKNTEAMVFCEEESELRKISAWAKAIIRGRWCKEINRQVIDDYELGYKAVRKLRDKAERTARTVASRMERQFEYRVVGWANLVADFRAHMTEAAPAMLAERKKIARKLPSTLNAPSFKVEYKGLKEFYETGELGELREVHTHALAGRRGALSRTLNFLANESVPIAERYQQSVSREGDYHLPGIGQNFASKFLASLHPGKYPALNKRVERVMRYYLASYQRGISLGRKYELFAQQMQLLTREVSGADMIDLDHFFYWRSRKL